MNRSVGLLALVAFGGFLVGYNFPRDVEIESTKPISLHYEITPEAAKILVFKYAEDQGESFGLKVAP